jgi:hypothetical protein
MSELIVDGVKVLGQYKEGTDRNAAAQEIFGKSVDGSSRMMLMTNETMADTKKTMEELGLVVGSDSVEAWKEFDSASDRANFGLQGVTKAIGEALMPVLTTLLEAFNAAMPAAIVVIRGALSGLTTAFLALRNGVAVVWEVINAMVVSVAEPIRALGEAIGKALVGDFKGAAAAVTGINANVKAAWVGAFNEISASSQKTHDQIARLWSTGGPPTSGGGQGEGTKSYAGKDKKEAGGSEKADPSIMQALEYGLTLRKIAYEKENLLMQFQKENELAYWREMLASKTLTEADRLKIISKSASLELEVMRSVARKTEDEKNETAKRVQEMDRAQLAEKVQWAELANESELAAEMHRIETLEVMAAAERDQETINQAAYLEKQAVFDQARLDAELAFLDKKKEIWLNDPDRNLIEFEKIEQQKEAIRNKYAIKQQALVNQVTNHSKQQYKEMTDTIAGSLSNFFESWWTKEKTFAQARDDLLKSWATSVISMLANMAAKWAATKVAEMVLGKTAAVSNVASHSAAAGAAGVASFAGAPWPINMGAPAFGAAMAATAASYGALASASGGFDIPAGMNPLTQLHQKEMVLPAHIAEPLRDQLAGGGGSGTIIIQATGGDFIHKKDLAKLLKKMNRDYAFA